MKTFLRKLKRKIMRPRVLRRLETAGTHAPRKRDAGPSGSIPDVYRIQNASGLEDFFKRLDKTWDAHMSSLFPAGCRVLIKINLNTADPYPASTDVDMLLKLIDFLSQKGVGTVEVGDCSANFALPTMKVARKKGMLDALSGRADMVCFDKGKWVRVPIGGRYLDHVTVPERVFEVDRIIYLANMKTHRHAGVTLSRKLGVGFMHPLERPYLHREHIQEKVGELGLAVEPDLIIIDGRKAFIDGGPIEGRLVEPGIVLAGEDMLSVDIEAYRQIYNLKERHGCLNGFMEDPFSLPQFSHARDMGPGAQGWKGYNLIDL